MCIKKKTNKLNICIVKLIFKCVKLKLVKFVKKVCMGNNFKVNIVKFCFIRQDQQKKLVKILKYYISFKLNFQSEAKFLTMMKLLFSST